VSAAGICDGRVAIITGAGRGIGREHALLLASEGASVVVCDTGALVDGSGADAGPAEGVAREITDAGGTAIASTHDAADWEDAQRLVNLAVETFGDLHVVVNNAGILRDRMLVNMTEEEWDSVIRVHLKGTFSPTRWAAAYWREQGKAGVPVDARIINTSSASGLFGNIGQTNYGAAKAGIAAFTLIAAQELARYGVTVNAIAPVALTRMTENLIFVKDDADGATYAPAFIAPTVCYLASPLSAGITGRVFDVSSRLVSVVDGWVRGRGVEDPSLHPKELGDALAEAVAASRPPAGIDGYPRTSSV
jgi:NAD(P)-dependent dehydrogenase (short-subunit alcohol dehydrogenase family)